MYRFLLSRRWLGGLALAVAVAIGCVLLGMWQWDRRAQQLERNTLVSGNYDRPPTALDTLLPVPGSPLPDGSEWTPVELSGRYLTEASLLLRNRPLDGRPGYHSLVPFETDGGAVLLVDRGWLPIGATGAGPDDVPVPPDGEVRAVVRVRPAERAETRDAPEGQVYTIDPRQLAGSLPDPDAEGLRTTAYGVLASEQPAAGTAPLLLPRPAVDEGPHLSYSLQWFVFALGALVAFVVLVRRTAGDDDSPGPAVRPARRRPSAEDEEDALVDAAEQARSTPRAG